MPNPQADVRSAIQGLNNTDSLIRLLDRVVREMMRGSMSTKRA
jgi:hypothetical protein